jgi:AcrR family transcriptional regulator
VPRPKTIAVQRKKLLPVVTRTFAELGYRRTTIAELALRCGVQEPILYRLWRDKKAMFLGAIAFVYENSAATWTSLIRDSAESGGKGVAARLLDYEARHHGELGLYRIIFAGLTESDDPEISRAVALMYRRFHRFLTAQIGMHRKRRRGREPADELAAWGLVGLGTVVNIIREFGLATGAERGRLFTEVGRLLLDGRAPGSHSEGSS